VPLQSHSGYGAVDARTGQHVSGSFSYAAFEAFRDRVPQFSGLVGFAGIQFTVAAASATDYGYGELVTGNYFQVLGVRPLIGRPIMPSDDAVSQPPVVVLTYPYWQKRFQSDPEILGRAIAINRRPTTVIGVLPETFQGLYAGRAVDFFLPMSRVDSGDALWYSRTHPDNWWVQIFGRLRPGVSDDSAAAALTATLGRTIEDFAGHVPAAGKPPVLLAPGAQGVGLARRRFATALYILGGTVCLVLLIACANLANLLLARAAGREREIAIRLSIGAGRWRLLRQLCTESLLLSCAGGLAGLLLSAPLASFLVRFEGNGQGLAFDVRLDARALAFTFAVSLLTGLLFGSLPAWRATRVDLGAAIKTAGSGATHSRSRLRFSRLLIAAQVAISLILLVGAALFTRTLIGLARVDLGYRPGNLLVFQTDPSRIGYQNHALADLYGRLRAQIAAIPGVESVATSQHGLMQGVESDAGVYVPGRRPQPQVDHAMILSCSDSFLSTMRIPLLYGRDLSTADGPNAGRVAVVNEAFRELFFGSENPIGRIFYLGSGQAPLPDEQPIQIVGVARNAHYTGVRETTSPIVYGPYLQNIQGLHQMTFAIRTVLPPLSLAPAVRRAVAVVDPSVPVVNLRTEEQQIRETLGTERLFAGLVSFFGLMASLFAAIGLYGVMAYSVSRRTAEIGIRMALGASRAKVQWMMIRGSLVTVLFGVAMGVPAAVILARVTRSLLFGITSNDAVSFIAACLMMLAVSAAAAWVPARRAARIEPTTALHYE